VEANARTAATDASTIAYIGELAPGSSLDAIPALSDAGILQVTPGDTATNLKGTTVARVVPTDSDQAIAQLLAMQKQGVKRLYLVKDATTYGTDIATATRHDAATYGITIVDPRGRYLGFDNRLLLRAIAKSKAGALLYAGSAADALTAFWNQLSAQDAAIKKFASASITEAPAWGQTTLAARENTFLSAPGLPNPGLPRAGIQFVNDFTAAYGSQATWASGIFGYVAMSGVLNALYGIGPHVVSPRAQVLAAFLATTNLPSALGTYSIVDGQTTFQHYFFTRCNRSGCHLGYTPGLS
jgi:ABC-type branched-subunit amino acid transport system substrate-binding protein